MDSGPKVLDTRFSGPHTQRAGGGTHFFMPPDRTHLEVGTMSRGLHPPGRVGRRPRHALILFGAMLLSALAVTGAVAKAPPGTVTLDITGCTVTVKIDLDQAYDLVGWKIKEYNAANWNDGKTLFKGSAPTDADGVLVVGPFTAPEGHYNVAVDNENPPDGSSIVVDFWLSCPPPEDSAAPPSGDVKPSDAVTPSDAVLPSELPATGSGNPPPSGEVQGVVGTPNVTPPPTDATVASPGAGDRLPTILLGVALVAAAVLLTTPRRARLRARSSVGSRRR